MLLAIDVGNTNIVLGLKEAQQWVKTWRISTYPIGTADELRLKVENLFVSSKLDFAEAKEIIVSSVVPPVEGVLREVFTDRRLWMVDWSWPFSFSIRVNPPSQVGVDRLVNAEAAVKEHGCPVIVIDSGTATTLCAVGSDGAYWGGAIMPGIELSIETLAKRTAKLFTVDLRIPSKAIGSSTQEALQSGLMLGYASMIDGMIQRFKRELKLDKVPVIATGGVSSMLKGVLSGVDVFDPQLTLKGLDYLYERVREHT